MLAEEVDEFCSVALALVRPEPSVGCFQLECPVQWGVSIVAFRVDFGPTENEQSRDFVIGLVCGVVQGGVADAVFGVDVDTGVEVVVDGIEIAFKHGIVQWGARSLH